MTKRRKAAIIAAVVCALGLGGAGVAWSQVGSTPKPSPTAKPKTTPKPTAKPKTTPKPATTPKTEVKPATVARPVVTTPHHTG